MANGLLAKNGLIVTGSVEVQNAVTASTFSGDGSGLSGVSDFPYTGSAIINGSLEVIGNTNFTGSINLLNSSTNRINFNNAAAINQPQIRLKDYATGITMRGNDVLALMSNGSGMIGIKKTGIAAINFPSNAQVGFTFNTSVESYQPYLYFHRYDGNTIGIGVYGGSSTANTNGRLILQHITASGHISASTYYGDGSNLTGIETDPFPYTGDVIITGSNSNIASASLEIVNSNEYPLLSLKNNGTLSLGHTTANTTEGNLRLINRNGDSWMGGQNLWGNISAGIMIQSEPTNTLYYRNLLFYVKSTQSAIAGVEKMRFDYNGNLGIGTSSPQERLHVNGNAVITGSNSLAGSYALKVANSSGTNLITAENDGTVEVGTSSYKLTVDGNISKFGNTFRIDQSGGDRKLYLTNFDIIDTTYNLNIQAVGIGLSSNTINLGGGNGKTININKGGSSETSIPNNNGVEMLFKPQAQGHTPQYSILRGTDTSFQPVPLYIFGGANTNTTYTSAQTGSVILQYIPNVGARGNVGIGLDNPQTNLHVSSSVSASTYYGDGSNLTGIDSSDFSNLPTSDPSIAGRLFQTSSDAIGASAGFQVVLISQG